MMHPQTQIINKSIVQTREPNAVLSQLSDILLTLSPCLTKSSIELITNGYGYNNTLYRVACINTNGKTDDYLIRIYGSSNSKMVKREEEVKIQQFLSKSNLAPKIFVLLNNGRIEEYYTDSIVIDPIFDPKFEKQIACKMCDIHEFGISNPNVINRNKASIMDTIEEWYNISQNIAFYLIYKHYAFHDYSKYCQIYEKWDKLGIYNGNIEKEINFLKQYIIPKNNESTFDNAIRLTLLHNKNVNNKMNNENTSNELKIEIVARYFMYANVLSHNDVCTGNGLYNSIKNELYLIDWEFSSYNFRAFDFAAYFGPCDRFKFNPNTMAKKWQRIKFIEAYIVYYLFSYDKYDKNALKDEMKGFKAMMKQFYQNKKDWKLFLSKCDQIVIEFSLANSMLWAFFGCINSYYSSRKDYDYLNYAQQRLIYQYNFLKNDLLPKIRDRRYDTIVSKL